MRSRQIDKFDSEIVGLERADMLLDRHARVIADTLAQAGQTIEECAFARVRATDHRNTDSRLSAYGYVRYRNSCFRRLSHQTLATRRQNGVPAPGEAKCHIQTGGIP